VYKGDAATTTNAYGRLDYALPARGLEVIASGVFSPREDDPLHRLVSPPDPASDHRLVWVDLRRPQQHTPLSPATRP
jgi:hypothetical protein